MSRVRSRTPRELEVARTSVEHRRKSPELKKDLSSRRSPPTVEARRLAELAMAAGFGASADDLILRSDRESLAMLGADDDSPLLADVLRWQGSVLRDGSETVERVRVARFVVELLGDGETALVQVLRVRRLAAVAQHRSLPAQNVREQRRVVVGAQHRERLAIGPENQIVGGRAEARRHRQLSQAASFDSRRRST